MEDFDDDFESQYADQIEIMQELEAEAAASSTASRTVSSITITKSVTPKLSETLNDKKNEYNSLNSQKSNEENDENELDSKKRKGYKDKEKNLEDLELNELSLNEFTESELDCEKELGFDYENENKDEPDSEEPIDTRSFQLLGISLLSGRKCDLKFFDVESEIEVENKRPKQKAILGKSIESLKIELSNESLANIKNNIADLDNDTINFDPKNTTETALWVEKFRPKNFIELLSDDGTNRLILSWVKSWDYVVFGKEMHSEAQSALSTRQLNLAAAKKRKRVFNQYEADFEDKILELDQYNRPKIKVCLISGPPGLGKTTLAHIIAKHAGYDIIEMNASDDRSADAFKQNIESVTQSRGSVNVNSEKTSKPLCLIIDEIDGAPAHSIQVLIDHVNEKVKSNKKNANTGLTMNRPIICICNDLYAPALKNLRPIAIVFQCPNIATQRLAERLNTVCKISKINADIGGLVALCEKTRNDIRSSLNTLQFLSSRSENINAKLINELTIGHKDSEKSIYEIMNEIFFTTKNNKKSLVNVEQISKFNMIYTMCQNTDFDKLFQALYENYLNVKFRDNNFESVNKANEWLMFSDRMNKQIHERQEYFLYRYKIYMPALFYKLFSTSSAPDPKNRLKYPHMFFENMCKLNKNTEILKHFQADMSPLVRVNFNSMRYTITDLLPFLNDILQPNLRSVALQLFTKIEKDKLENLIRQMILFNLSYRQEKNAEGKYSYVLEPNIDEVIKLSGSKQRKQLGYVIKQQLAREITLEKVRIADKFKSKQNEGGEGQMTTKPSIFKNIKKVVERSISSPKASPLRNLSAMMKEKIQPSMQNEFNKERADKFRQKNCFSTFFIKKEKKLDEGLTPNSRKVAENQRAKNALPLTDGVWLKYKEGFINAVRYTIKISDLL